MAYARNPNTEVCIYVLRDPDTNAVRYVGRSMRPEERLYSHKFNVALDKNPRKQWLASLQALGKYPTIEIVEKTVWAEAKAAEKRWVKHFIEQGCELTNVDHNPKVYNTYWKNQVRNIG